jgi:hypothetical protein
MESTRSSTAIAECPRVGQHWGTIGAVVKRGCIYRKRDVPHFPTIYKAPCARYPSCRVPDPTHDTGGGLHTQAYPPGNWGTFQKSGPYSAAYAAYWGAPPPGAPAGQSALVRWCVWGTPARSLGRGALHWTPSRGACYTRLDLSTGALMKLITLDGSSVVFDATKAIFERVRLGVVRVSPYRGDPVEVAEDKLPGFHIVDVHGNHQRQGDVVPGQGLRVVEAVEPEAEKVAPTPEPAEGPKAPTKATKPRARK